MKGKNNNGVIHKCCSYCQIPTIKSNLIRCSHVKCDNLTCKSCLQMINNKPICPECMLNFIKHDVSFMVFKGDGAKLR